MSSDGVNSYVQKLVSPTMEFSALLAKMDKQLSSAKTRSGKHFLAELREICLYAVPGQRFPSTEFAIGLMRAVEGSNDPDADRKALRVCYFLLMEYLHSNHMGETNFDALFTSFLSYLQRIAISHLTGSSLCLAWRHLGRAGGLLLARQGPTSTAYSELTETMHRSMKSLKYPEKKKGFMGREKGSEAYDTALHVWTATFSALRRSRVPPAKEYMPTIFQGCMATHQALSRHGFALLTRAVESNPAEFCPFLLEKLKDGHFFSHASIDSINCSQLVNACRVMMTSDVATPEMIQHALTVIFNLLKSPRLAIALEAVRALTEAPQAWAFKESLAEIGGASIPSRIASALIGPIGSLSIRLDRGHVADATGATSASDDVDISLHSSHGGSPVKGPSGGNMGVGNSPLPKGKPATSAVHGGFIGEGDITLAPLCRACVRLGLYMVHRPSNVTDITDDDMQIVTILNAIKSLLISLDTLDCRVLAAAPINTDPLKTASLSVMPHVKAELLKSYLWLLPENRAQSNEVAEMWLCLEETMVEALPTLSENLVEGIISNMVARLRATHSYSHELVSMVIAVNEAAIAATGGTSAVLSCLLTQIWTVVGGLAGRWVHASEELLSSALRCIDGSVLQHGDTTSAPHSFSGHNLSAEQILRGLRHQAYWLLGEYAYLWIDVDSLRNAYCFENVAYHRDRTALAEIVPRLTSAMWLEQGSVQVAAIEALYKIAVYACKLSSSAEGDGEKFGLISFIRHEMNAVLGAVLGVAESGQCDGWVRNDSESMRLSSIGLPGDIIVRPDLLRAVSRGQYTEGSMDLARTLSAALLVLDTMWAAPGSVRPADPEGGSSAGKDTAVGSSLLGMIAGENTGRNGAGDAPQSGKVDMSAISLPIEEKEQLELLRLQLAYVA